MRVDGLRNYMHEDRSSYIRVDGAVYMYISRVTYRNNVLRLRRLH